MKLKRLFLLILIPIGYLLTFIASLDKEATEKFFSLSIYKVLSEFQSAIFGIFPFSVTEFIYIFGILSLIITLVISVRKSIKNKKYTPVLQYLVNILVLVSFMYLGFVLTCGINYHRQDFTFYYGKDSRDFTKEELFYMCKDYILVAGDLRENLTFDDLKVSDYEMAQNSYETFDKLAEKYPVLDGNYSNPKPMIISPILAYLNIGGFFFGYTNEANVNVSMPNYKIPFTMLHELVHQRGFMQENEANFVAFLAGKDSDDMLVQYSAYMSGVNYALNSLYAIDKEMYFEATQNYSDLQMADIAEYSEYFEQYDIEFLSDLSKTVNDSYLKANGQDEGIVTYSKVTELLLIDYYS